MSVFCSVSSMLRYWDIFSSSAGDETLSPESGSGDTETGEAAEEEISFPDLHPGAAGSDEDDPFADVEIDTEEKNFKW
jgi:hypothetical protein